MGLLGAVGTGIGAYFGGTSGAGIGGAIGGGLDSMFAGNASNAMAADEAQRNREFQADMSSTAYQRAVADMKAAGLNPMLAYQQGGASSPGGSMASFSNPEGATGSNMSAYSQLAVNSAQVKNIEADTANKSAQADLMRAQAAAANASAGQSNAQVSLINASAEKAKAEIEKIKGDTNFAVQQDILRQTAWQLHQAGVQAQEQGMTLGQQRAVMEQTAKKLYQETRLSQMDADAVSRLDNIGGVSKQLLPAIEIIKALFMRH